VGRGTHFGRRACHIFVVVVVPTWTLAIAAVAGVAIGVIVGRLLPRPRATEAPASAPQSDAVPPTDAAVTEEVLELVTAPPESGATAEEESSPEEEEPRIGMEDVVTELERRYQGRRAEEEKERARRKRDREPPSGR
jgi:hypothetical protein